MSVYSAGIGLLRRRARWFYTTLFALPRAGIVVGAIPFSFAFPLWVIIGLRDAVLGGIRLKPRHWVFVGGLIASLLVNFSTYSLFNLATLAVLLASLVPLSYTRERLDDILSSLPLAMVVIMLFGAIQAIVGVEITLIEGITHPVGENVLNDNPIRAGDHVKMVSTFTNGNPMMFFLFLSMAVSMERRVISQRRGLWLGAVVLISVLSLVRGSWVALVVGLAYAGFRGRGNFKVNFKMATYGVLGVLLGMAVLWPTGNLDAIVDRFVVLLTDADGNGRVSGAVTTWKEVWHYGGFEFVRGVLWGFGFDLDFDMERARIGRQPGSPIEGYLTFLLRFGVIVFGSILAMVAAAVRNLQGDRLAEVFVVAAATQALADNVLLFPPLLFMLVLAGEVDVRGCVVDDPGGRREDGVGWKLPRGLKSIRMAARRSL